MDDAELDRLLRALSDGTRRQLLDRLRDTPGLTQSALLAGFSPSRQALSKHLALLEAAGLVVTLWRGREKLHYLNPAPLQALPSRWNPGTARQHGAALQALQQALQQAHPAGSAADPASPADHVRAALLADDGPGLDGTRIASPAALAAALRYAAGTADAVRQLLAALGEAPERAADAAYRRPAGGGFSLAEHLWHLADLEELGWAPRFERLLVEAQPRLAGVDGDRLAVERGYQQRPWRGAARRFIAQRRRTLRTLARFDATALARPAVFGGRRSSAGDVLAAMVAHDREHRAEMAALWTP